MTSYNLQWDKGEGDFSGGYDLTGISAPYTATTFTQTANVLSGGYYLFRYRAKNIHGWGEYSDSISIVAASAPATPATVSTAISDIYVKITWMEPDTGGSAIDAY